EMAYVHKEDGRMTAARAIVGEHQILRLTVTGSGDKDKPTEFLDQAADFFNSVHPGPAFGPPIVEAPPAVTPTALSAAYKSAPKAADAKYKDHWLLLKGKLHEAAKDRTSFLMDAGDGAVVVRRATPARRTVPLPKPGGAVALTGKCRGLDSQSGQVVI